MDAQDLNTLKRILVELELKVASLEERLGAQNTAVEEILARLYKLERELKERK